MVSLLSWSWIFWWGVYPPVLQQSGWKLLEIKKTGVAAAAKTSKGARGSWWGGWWRGRSKGSAGGWMRCGRTGAPGTAQGLSDSHG